MATGRRPADQLAKHVCPPDRNGIWMLIREKKEDFTYRDLMGCGAARKTVTDYVKCLIAAEIIVQLETDDLNIKHFQLVVNYGAKAPRVRDDGSIIPDVSAVKNMWRTMRRQSVAITYKELALYASIEGCIVAESTAKTYIEMLQHLDCIKVFPSSQKDGGKLAKYQFIKSKDIGPKAPIIQRTKRLFDPNSNQVISKSEEVKEVKP